MDSGSSSGGSSNNPLHKFKVVLLGEGAVGKTSLVLRYVENKFNPKHVSTVQASFLVKKLNFSGDRLELSIWDTAGQERFHALGPIYYRGSHGAVLVYDITDQDSFQRVKNWVKELRKMLGTSVILCIAGNKTDLEKNRTVPEQDAIQYADSVGAFHFQTSAKLNQGIEEMFNNLAKRMLESAKATKSASPTAAAGNSSNSRGVVVVDSSDPFAGSEQSHAARKCC